MKLLKPEVVLLVFLGVLLGGGLVLRDYRLRTFLPPRNESW